MSAITVTTRAVLNFDEARDRAERAARAAAERGAGRLLELANETVPRDEGDLAASGSVEVDDEGNATIGYSAPYAIRQHEDTSLGHGRGGRAKWLQLSAEEGAREVGDETARAFEEGFR